MTQRTSPDDPYNRVHIAADQRSLIEHCTTDLADTDPIAIALDMVGVTAVTLRFVSGETLTYSKRAQS